MTNWPAPPHRENGQQQADAGVAPGTGLGTKGQCMKDPPNQDVEIPSVEAFVAKACDRFQASACVLRRVNGKHLDLVAAVGLSKEYLHPRLPADVGIGARILREGKPLAIENTITDPTTRRLIPVGQRRSDKFTFLSYAGVPVLDGQGAIVGILGLYITQTMRYFSTDDLAEMEHFARLVAGFLVE